MQRTIFHALVVVTALLAPPAAVRAHGYGAVGGLRFNTVHGADLDTMPTHMIQRKGRDKVKGQLEGPASAPHAAPAAPGPRDASVSGPDLPFSVTDFRPAGPCRVPEQLASGASKDRERQKIVETARWAHETMEGVAEFRRNKVAYAMAALRGAASQFSTGRELSEVQSEALLHQFNNTPGGLPAFKAMSDQSRTQLYDGLIITAGSIVAMAQEGAGARSPQLSQRATTLARSALNMFGIGTPARP